MDTVDAKTRSKIMARVRGKHTKPEMFLRKELFRQGYRYRVHAANLPGRPDVVFPKNRVAVFVHGCFWHKHDCGRFVLPATNRAYWKNKISCNVRRDAKSIRLLSSSGWHVFVVWECELENDRKKRQKNIVKKIKRILNKSRNFRKIPV